MKKNNYPKDEKKESPFKVKQILRKVIYKDFGIVKQLELIDGSEFGTTDMKMQCSYSLIDGGYIGDYKTANYLMKRGIAPEKSHPKHNVCSIGYCKKERKWYGWSHRAIYGFKTGSKCKKGMCQYNPKKGEWTARNMTEAKQMAIDFAESVS